MLNSTAIGNRGISNSALQQSLGTDVSVSGTGDFDFLNYLLGLQTAPTDVAADVNVLSLKTGDKESNQEEALLSVFDNKDQQLVNPMLAQVVQTPDNKAALLVKESTSETLNDTLKGDVISDRNNQKTQSMYDFSKGMIIENDTTNAKDVNLKAEGMEKPMTAQNPVGEANAKIVDKSYEKSVQVAKETQASQKLDSDKTSVKNQEVGQDISNVVHRSAVTKDSFEVAEGGRKHSKEGEEELFPTQVESGSQHLQALHPDLSVGKQKPTDKPSTLPEVFSKVESMVHTGGGKMTITLNPPSLGQVEVKVSTKGKNVEIEMKSTNEFAKTALENHVAELKTSMQAQDLVLQKMEVHVNLDMGDKNMFGGQFSQNQTGGNPYQQNSSGFREQSGNTGSSFKNFGTSQSVAAVSSRNEWKPAASVSGRVDIRV